MQNGKYLKKTLLFFIVIKFPIKIHILVHIFIAIGSIITVNFIIKKIYFIIFIIYLQKKY